MKKHALAAFLLAATLACAGCGGEKVTYKGLKLVRPVMPEITSVDVSRFIESFRMKLARAIPLDPGASLGNGDQAVIDFAGTIGGTPFEGGSGIAYPLVLGAGQMIPGFEEGIVGMKVGETRNVSVRFPSEYQEPLLAGRKAVFRITVRSGHSLARPPLDDTLASRVTGGQINSLAELRRAGREQLAQERVRRAEQQLKIQVVDALVGQIKWQPAERTVRAETDRLIQQHIQGAIQQGLKADVASQQAETLRPGFRASSIRNLKFNRIASYIAGREGIRVTDAELEQVARQMAQSQGQDPAGIMKYLAENNLTETLRKRVVEDRVLTLVIENAQLENQRPIREPVPPR